MELKVKKRNESYVSLYGDSVALQVIYDYFSFKPQNYQFTPAYRQKRWDGVYHLYDIHKNLFPLGLVFKLDTFCKMQNINITYEDFGCSGIKVDKETIENYTQNNLKMSIKLRDYQLDGVETALREQHCILLSPTGTGKSAMIYTILRMILKYNNKFKILIIVPTVGLVEQMVGDFEEYSANENIDIAKKCQKIYEGSKKDVEKQIVISTYQSLQNVNADYFRQFSALLVDECHTGSVKGNVINRIVTNCINAVYKIGFSGTLQDTKMNIYSLNGLYGKVYQLTQTRKEIDRGNLTNIKIYQIYLHYSDSDAVEFFNKRNKAKQMLAINSEMPKTILYQKEIEYVNEKDYKRNFICAICRKQKMNTLILFKRNSQFGYKLYDKMKLEFPDRNVFLITGSTEIEDRDNVRKICENNNNAIIIASYKIFSTGVNIKNLHNIIFGESIASKITTLQSIGRTLRLHESKKQSQLFDIVDYISYDDEINMMVNHAFKRLDIYKNEKFDVVKKDVLAENYKN